MPPDPDKTVCVVAPYEPSLSETFIRAHLDRLPARCMLVHGWRPQIGRSTVLTFRQLAAHKLRRVVLGEPFAAEVTSAYVQVLKRNHVDAVLAEYGETAVQVLPACDSVGVPLVAHFHGYDASVRSVLEANRTTYPVLFERAAAVIAVSRSMVQKLVWLGAPRQKVHYNPCGTDCVQFFGAAPADAGPVFLTVGRFVEKKAPQLSILAFSQLANVLPQARMRMIGDGPLFAACRKLVRELGIEAAVTFLGPQCPQVVQQEMRRARCFVQHSVEAPSGDCEGTPLGILEAGASGLPVVATRHAGIPDVVVDGETGFLVDEGDVDGMAQRLVELAQDAELAGRLGRMARKRVAAHFSMERSISGLWDIIESTIAVHRRRPQPCSRPD